MEKEDWTREEISFSDAQFKILIGDSHFAVREKTFHEEIEIKYFYEGTGSFAIDHNIIFGEAGDVIIINPYEVHANVQLEGRKGKYYNIIIGFDFFADEVKRNLNLTQKLLVEGKKFCTHIQNDARLTAIIFRVVKEIQEKKEHYQIVVHSLIGELFSILLRNYLDKERSAGLQGLQVDNMGAILPAISKIYVGYGKKLTVEELASCCNLSKYYFCRIFKKVMNKTAVQFLMEYRLNIAETLVKTSKKSFAEIAWMCGFETEGYFAKCYKRLKGKSPRKDREESIGIK